MTDTQELLSDYVNHGSEAAFRELMVRYFDLVYSTAVRLASGDTHLAEDITQIVFSDLSQTAGKLSEGTMLGGWLHRHTIFVCRTVMRGQRRRLFREQQAAAMRTLNDQGVNVAVELAPILDEAIDELGVDDRAAIVLRFFERRSLRSVGEALGMSENAAQKRVARAIHELGLLLQKRGVTVSLAALGSVLATTVVQAAPVGLALTMSEVALAKVGTSTSSGLVAAKVAVFSKLKAGIAAAVMVTTLVTLFYFSNHNTSNAPAGNRTARQQSLEPQENTIAPGSAVNGAATLASDSQALKPAPQTVAPEPGLSGEKTTQDAGSALLQPPLLPGGFAGKMRYTAKPGANKLRITGMSNIHDWHVETALIGGYIELGIAPPAPALTGTSSNSVWAKAEAFIPARSLASVKEDGSPYSTSMDDLIFQSLKVERHPRIIYSLLDLSFKGSTNYQGATWFEYSSKGKLAIAGVTNDISMPVFILPMSDGKLNICGATTLKMTSFNIKPPTQKLLSQTVQAADAVSISFSWNVAARP